MNLVEWSEDAEPNGVTLCDCFDCEDCPIGKLCPEEQLRNNSNQ